MRRLRVLCIGRARQPLVRATEQEYGKRLGRDWALQVEEIDLRPSAAIEPARIRQLAADAMLARLAPDERLVLLDPRGRSFDSEQFAAWLGQQDAGATFAIGGALGWNDAARARAQLVWSLGPLTFAHELVRALLAEQLYRAVTILRGEPYHRG
jgi:23S rRNA (pseudouridine1915-N3)-methyltransferase